MISVIACTHREDFIKNIIANFQKQSLRRKELILILNGAGSGFDQNLLKGMGATVLRFPPEVSLGECLNKGAAAAAYGFVAKMDDDDYYGPGYLQEAYQAFEGTGADVTGKSSFYIYFKNMGEVRLYNPHHTNSWMMNEGSNSLKAGCFLSGASLVFKKKLLDRITFPHTNLGEDTGFQQLCFENHLKIYSLSKEHYAYIRYETPLHHTSDAKESLLRRRSQFIANVSSINDFMEKCKRQ